MQRDGDDLRDGQLREQEPGEFIRTYHEHFKVVARMLLEGINEGEPLDHILTVEIGAVVASHRITLSPVNLITCLCFARLWLLHRRSVSEMCMTSSSRSSGKQGKETRCR